MEGGREVWKEGGREGVRGGVQHKLCWCFTFTPRKIT